MTALQCNSRLSYPLHSFTNKHSFVPSTHSSRPPSLIITAAWPPGSQRGRNVKKLKTKPNSLPVLKKLHVKIGDTVKVISGHEKGKVSEVINVNKTDSTILVKDVNLKTKHMSGKQEGESGQIVQVEGPIHSSNVMLYSKTQNVASRIGHKILEDGTKVRYLLKTGEVIDTSESWAKIQKKNILDKKDT